MKRPKITKKYCKFCRKATEQKTDLYKSAGKRGSLKKGSLQRAKKRGLGVGYGNKGKWGSRPAISKFKRTGAKISKKTTYRYKCSVCGKSTNQSHGIRAKKMEFKEK